MNAHIHNNANLLLEMKIRNTQLAKLTGPMIDLKNLMGPMMALNNLMGPMMALKKPNGPNDGAIDIGLVGEMMDINHWPNQVLLAWASKRPIMFDMASCANSHWVNEK